MSGRTMTKTGKIAVGMAIAAALLTITATLITYLRFGKINVMPLISGLIVSLLVIFLVRSNKKR